MGVFGFGSQHELCMHAFSHSVNVQWRNCYLFMGLKTLKPVQDEAHTSLSIDSHNFTDIMVFECLLKPETKPSFRLGKAQNAVEPHGILEEEHDPCGI